MSRKLISVIGYVDMDLTMIAPRIPDAGESLQAKSYSTSPGGKGANAAVAAFRSIHFKAAEDEEGKTQFKDAYDEVQVEVRMIGAVGDDGYGREAVENLQTNGVDASGVRVVENEYTGICFCMVEAGTGENRLLFTTGATSTLAIEDFQSAESLGNGVRPDLLISQLEVRRDTVEHIMKVAWEAGIPVLLNAAPAAQILHSTYQYLTHLIVNETEAAMLSGREVDEVVKDTWHEIAEDFLDLGVENVVITLGAQGAYYANKEGAGHVSAEKVEDVVDATGAGDTFVGTYATDYLRQKARDVWNIRDAVHRANRASAFTICKVGAQQSIPWANEIDNFSVESLPRRLSRPKSPVIVREEEVTAEVNV